MQFELKYNWGNNILFFLNTQTHISEAEEDSEVIEERLENIEKFLT